MKTADELAPARCGELSLVIPGITAMPAACVDRRARRRPSAPATTTCAIEAKCKPLVGVLRLSFAASVRRALFEPKSFADIPDEDWLRFFEVNVMSGVRLSRHYLPGMVARKWGRVVFISSESAVQIPAAMIHYGVTA